jgi:DNA-directed RNA polymerase specialized sigma24 family protein
MEKIYKVRICFGDGKPVETSITAKGGIEAQDKAIKAHPGARTVHILGATEVEQKKEVVSKGSPAKPPPPVIEDEPHPLFTDVSKEEVKRYVNKDKLHRLKQVQSAVELRSKGLTHRQIAASLGIGSTTVGTWLKQYGFN